MNTTRAGRSAVVRRTLQLFTTLAIVAGLSVATAGAAMATNVGEQACKPAELDNACLLITNLGGGWYGVYVAMTST